MYVGIDASIKRIAIVTLGPRGAFHESLYKEFDDLDLRGRLDFLWSCIPTKMHAKRIMLEGSYLGPNRRGSLDHAEQVGVVMAAISMAGWDNNEVRTILPANWRSLCGIKGRGKAPVMEWAVDKYGSAITNQDVADATAIAYAGIKMGDTNA